MRLKPRLDALEAKAPVIRHWHRVFQYAGQTEADAVAAYEGQHGAIEPGDGRIVRAFVTPRTADGGLPCPV